MHANDHHFHANPAGLRSPERLTRLQLDRVTELSLEGTSAHSLLDLGTGTGLGAQAFAERGVAVTALDDNAQMLDIARTYVGQAAFVQSELENLPFRYGAFDLVYLGHVLHEASDFRQALREARRVARIRAAVLEWPYEAPSGEHGGPPLDVRIAPEALRAAAASSGFSSFRSVRLMHNVLYLLDSR